MSVYSYGRTSEVEELEADNDLEGLLEQENLRLQTYALSQGMRINETCLDRAQIWTRNFSDRPQGARLLERMEYGDILLCNSIERIFSSCEDMLHTIQLLQKRHIRFYIVELGGDLTQSSFNPSFHLLLKKFQQLEKRRSKERSTTVKHHQRNKGRFLGGSRPFGYMIHSNGSLIENPMEQRVLKKIIRMKEEGKSLRAISSEVSTPMVPVSFKTVQRLLKRHQEQSQAGNA